MKKRPLAIDLFCGAGGMSLGFEQAGFDVALAVDHDPKHILTYQQNFPSAKTICGDIQKIKGEDLLESAGIKKGEVTVVFGGPPCQGFSLIGKRQVDDYRNQLIHHFARLVRETRPLYFVMENVGGLLIGQAVKVFKSFVRRSKLAGYEIVTPVEILNASDFGVPQRRKRVIIIGYQKGLSSPEYPSQNGTNPILPGSKGICVWDAIGDLPNVDDFEELITQDTYHGPLGKASLYAKQLRSNGRDCSGHSKRKPERTGLTGCLRTLHKPDTVRRFSKTLAGEFEPRSRYYRLNKEGLSHTLRAGSGPDRGSFTAPRPIHPEHPRCITVREAARLHSFPDWFVFHPTKWHGFRQVGNSVPPMMAKAIAMNVICEL